MKFDDFFSKFERPRKTTAGWLVRCPAHEDKTASLQICKAADGKILLKCFAGCTTEIVVAALGLKMRDLFPDSETKAFTPPIRAQIQPAPATTEKPTIEKIYSYQNHAGEEVYQALRLRPKSFRQRHMVDGKWNWTMDGVTRVLYQLPQILKAQKVWVVEGEKDAENLSALGFVATCNVGGAGKWLDAYTETLAGKDVVICGDNDDAGKKHVDLVFESIAGTAKTVRLVKLPDSIKDVSDYITTFKTANEAGDSLASLAGAAHPHLKGVSLPIFTIAELEQDYRRFVSAMETNSFSLGKWIPSLGKIRPLVPGELVFIIGDTGIGKTGILQQIARAALPLPTLMFELELPKELMFERFAAMTSKITCRQIEHGFQNSQETMAEGLDFHLKNLFVCAESRLSVQQIENYIMRSELKIGERPKVVLLDYVQLVGAEGVNRREKISDIAEGLKVMAKVTRTMVIVASQVSRPAKDEEDWKPTLHSAKESGSIESSCGLLMGISRDAKDGSLLQIRILKSTKGGAGLTIDCNFDGERMIITERTKIISTNAND